MAHCHYKTHLQGLMAAVFIKRTIQLKMMNIPKGASRLGNWPLYDTITEWCLQS